MASEFSSSPSTANLVATCIAALSRIAAPNLLMLQRSHRASQVRGGRISGVGMEPYHAIQEDSRHGCRLEQSL
jgi:hypothetical protein